MNAKDELDKWLDSRSEKVQRNVEIVTPKELGQDYFLHVSVNTNIKEFVPRIGDNQMPNEDRTVPRLCVAPTILGCLGGMGAFEHYFHEFEIGQKSQSGVTYKGGVRIYEIPFEAALKPNNKMVPDVKHSDEYWVVAYNKDTAVIVPKSVGKVFIESIRYFPRNGKQPMAECTLYIEVAREEGMWFTNGVFLEKGYWSVEGPASGFTTMTWSDKTQERMFKVKSLEKSDYQAVKTRTAALLSHNSPAWCQW